MKYRWISLLVIVALAAAAGGLTYHVMRDRAAVAMNDAARSDALMWIRQEFKLDAVRMARIEKMHSSFHTICEGHCEALQQARVALAQARAQNRPASELAEAEALIARVDAQCKASTEAHMRAVAEVIGGSEGQRYLSIVLPRVGQIDHERPATLDLGHNSHSHNTGAPAAASQSPATALPASNPHEHHVGN